MHVAVEGADGAWWDLNFQAPAGQALQAGTYTGVLRYPFNNDVQPGLDTSGSGRGCNTLTGSFTVTNVVFGPHGYVQNFDAGYEQHCEGGIAALTGEVHITNPPPPPDLALGVDIATDGTVGTLTGEATVHGTVRCTKAAEVAVAGTVTEVPQGSRVTGSYETSVACVPGESVAWSAKAVPSGTAPFQPADAEVTAKVTADDVDFDDFQATAEQTAAVSLA